jgi:hypothetical protein
VQNASGVLDMEIGGLQAGTQSDQLQISGTATLGGTLNVSVINGFTPAAGNTFPLVTCRTRTGTFGTINGLQQSGYSFTPDYDSGDFYLVSS